MIYRVTPVCFYLDGFSLECQLKTHFTLFLCAQRLSFVVKTPSTHHLFFHSLPAGGDYHCRSYTVLLLAHSPPSSPTLHPTPEVLWHCSKEEECAGAFPTHPPHYCWNLACSVPPTWKKCPGVTPELKCHDLEIRRRKKSFHSFPFKINFPSFPSDSPQSNPKELLDL